MNKINWNGITVELVSEFTPEMAKDILAKHNSKNRRLSKSHANLLRINMEKGTWLFNGDSICFDDKGELIDGQHRLSALSSFGKPLPLLVVRGLPSEAIKTIDQTHKNRSLADLLKIDGITNTLGKQGMIRRYFALRNGANISSGSNSRYIAGSNGSIVLALSKTTIDDQYSFYYQFKENVEDAYVYASKCYDRLRILPKSEIGGYILFLSIEKKHSDEDITGFFDRLFFNNTDNEGINLLRTALINDAISGSLLPSTREAYFRKAWNAYISNIVLKKLVYDKNKENTIEIL